MESKEFLHPDMLYNLMSHMTYRDIQEYVKAFPKVAQVISLPGNAERFTELFENKKAETLVQRDGYIDAIVKALQNRDNIMAMRIYKMIRDSQTLNNLFTTLAVQDHYLDFMLEMLNKFPYRLDTLSPDGTAMFTDVIYSMLYVRLIDDLYDRPDFNPAIKYKFNSKNVYFTDILYSFVMSATLGDETDRMIGKLLRRFPNTYMGSMKNILKEISNYRGHEYLIPAVTTYVNRFG